MIAPLNSGESSNELVRGSPTCRETRYVSIVRDRLVESSDMVEILAARDAAGLPIDVDHQSISHLLHDGFVPPPRTVYRDIYTLGMDLEAKRSGGYLAFERNFPYTNGKSSQAGVPSTRTLLTLLAAAVESACATRDEAFLSLSSGVDSTSLAVAAKEAGRDDLLCVTYGESPEDFEINYARRTCASLGLRHVSHILDPKDSAIQETLRDYASGCAQPCCDPALIADVSMVARFGESRSVMLDGSGSDFYFWRPPARRLDLIKTRLGFGQLPPFHRVRALVPMDFWGERILATPPELMLLHGVWLRFYETRQFYPNATDTHPYWIGQLAYSASFPREERQHCLKMAYMAPAAYMMKTRNAVSAFRAKAQFPWTDQTVADYCFNLPENARFNRATKVSKVIVRQMLSETLDYDHRSVGKRTFSFGKRDFLLNHLEFCREEILSCTLWSTTIVSAFNKLARKLERGGQTENALLSLLMVSLWHNRWINGSMRGHIRKCHSLRVDAEDPAADITVARFAGMRAERRHAQACPSGPCVRNQDFPDGGVTSPRSPVQQPSAVHSTS